MDPLAYDNIDNQCSYAVFLSNSNSSSIPGRSNGPKEKGPKPKKSSSRTTTSSSSIEKRERSDPIFRNQWIHWLTTTSIINVPMLYSYRTRTRPRFLGAATVRRRKVQNQRNRVRGRRRVRVRLKSESGLIQSFVINGSIGLRQHR